MNERLTLFVSNENEGERIDSYIASEVDDVSRTRAQQLIENGNVLCNGVVSEKKKKVKLGDVIEIEIPEPDNVDILPENIPIEVVYEDSDLAVINKKQGMTVHPAGGVRSGTLVNALLYRFGDLSGINGEIRPGIVHRLDKDTSGLMVVAKNDKAHRYLAEQIAVKECRRIYYALCEGVIKEDNGIVDQPIGRSRKDRKKMAVNTDGRKAVTLYTVLERFAKNTLVRYELKTGRTHQIRVHAKFLGHPVVGDKAYGFANQRFNLKGQLLHSKTIVFKDLSGKELSFDSELPDYFKKVLELLEKTEKID